MEALYVHISKVHKINLTDFEKKGIRQSILDINLDMFRGHPKKEVYNVLSKVLGEGIMRERKRIAASTEVDMHEYLNKQIAAIDNQPVEAKHLYADDPARQSVSYATSADISSLLGYSDAFTLQKIFNPPATYVKNYLVLDSKYRILEDDPNGDIKRFKWAYVENANIENGVINSVGKIRDVVSMYIYKPLIPYVANYMSLNSNRISILIEEFGAQSFILANGRRAHWLFALKQTYNDLMVSLSIEDYNDGIFNFRKPITTFDTITMSFGNPDTLIPFQLDRDEVTFTYGNRTVLTTVRPHGFQLGSALHVTISGFRTGNPVADSAVISAMNSQQEKGVTLTGPNTMNFSVNTSTITPIPGLIATVYYEERRFIIPIELTHLRSDK
jgi:hypothetical protein